MLKKSLSYFLSLFHVFFVFILITFGALITSHGAGLSVPDWPSSYGYNMFTFPISMWIGGIFYEHVHRLIASFVGFWSILLFIIIWYKEKQKSLTILSLCILILVIIQGVFGGLTVLLGLPDWTSVIHGVLGQSFFLLSLFLFFIINKNSANNLSLALFKVFKDKLLNIFNFKIHLFLILILIITYLQLILAAYVRHSESGLAILDFPTTAKMWIPDFSEKMLNEINTMRKSIKYGNVEMWQVAIAFTHRLVAFLILFIQISFILFINKNSNRIKNLYKNEFNNKFITAIKFTTFLLILQINLGIFTIFSLRNPIITSLHVIIGASFLAFNFWLLLELLYQDTIDKESL